MEEKIEEPKENNLQITNLEENRQKLLQVPGISLWLDDYNDIFSDFDPRPYSQRALSDDFLYEAKKASIGKDSEIIELKILIPANKRNAEQESIIKRRLRKHFSKHFCLLKKEIRRAIKRGVFFLILGIILMFIATFILFRHDGKHMFMSFFIVLLEPAGWFLFWEGLSAAIFESRKTKPDLEFYGKMSKCRLTFLSY